MTVTTFAYTGALQTFTVPAGVTSIKIECWGGKGGANGPLTSWGGLGGYASGVLVVAPATVLNVYVGGSGASGGWNGGGAVGGGASGGGASDVRQGGTTLSNRVIVGGGGGAGWGVNGGIAPGGAGGGSSGGSNGGIGGTQTTGYALGSGAPGPNTGGGGGYYGGFNGPNPGNAAGGGSGYLSSTLTSTTMTNGLRSGDGQVVITALNTAPLAATLTTPATNAYVFAGDANTFAWTFNDPDAGDYQTRADFRWRVGTGAWITVTSAATTVAQYVVAASTFTAGTLVEWQVSTYDNASAQGPWSASSFVNVITALAAPTITAPAPGSAQYATPVSLEWTTTPTGDAYRVTRTQNTDGTGTLYYDSGVVLSSATNAQIPLDPIAGRTDYLRVAFRLAGHWSPYSSVAINSQFGPPAPALVVLTPDSNKARVMVTITNPAQAAGFASAVSNDIARTSPDGSTVRIAKGLAPNATFVDLKCGAGLNTYTVTAFAASGSTSVSA